MAPLDGGAWLPTVYRRCCDMQLRPLRIDHVMSLCVVWDPYSERPTSVPLHILWMTNAIRAGSQRHHCLVIVGSGTYREMSVNCATRYLFVEGSLLRQERGIVTAPSAWPPSMASATTHYLPTLRLSEFRESDSG